MKNLLKFFLETEKLKEMPRTGWVWLEVENPETIAAHLFRVAIMNWVLARKVKPKLNLKKIIKISLAHDLCEVYAGDMTPYWGLLPKNKEKRKEFLKRWVRVPLKVKKKRGELKFNKEKEAVEKLVEPLPLKLRKEIMGYWLNYEKMSTREGKFVRQGDKIETMIQAIQYFGVGDTPVIGWWEEVEELVDTSPFLEFLKIIEEKFYEGRSEKREIEEIIDFLFEIGKLKTMPRTLWALMGIKNPETVAGHTFTTALMSWVFGVERKGFDLERVLKMALCHEFPSVYTGDLITPFILPKGKEKREIFEKWPRLKKKEKEKIFFEDYQKEKKAIEKLTQKLEPTLRKEIIGLWDEYKNNLTPEARFVNQINVLAVLLQALLYQKKNKNLPIGWIWEWAFEKCEEPVIFEFCETLKEKFSKSF
jgi:putative hydrolase of HD superfamily